MDTFSLTTPALLFSAISLIMLAYTNRFLSYAQLVRSLHAAYLESNQAILLWQIHNLRKRLYLTRAMQITGIMSLLACVVSMFLLYLHFDFVAKILFGVALLCLVASLLLLIWEIQISVKALKIHLRDIEEKIDEVVESKV